MNELIEELFEKYATERRNNVSILFTDFQQAIQTACEAQRNACLRVCNEFDLPQNNFDRMATAEITEEDYE